MSLVCAGKHRVSPLCLLESFSASTVETSRRRVFTNGSSLLTARAPTRKATVQGRVATPLRSPCQKSDTRYPSHRPIHSDQRSARMKHRAFVALGSNLGDRVAMIEQACNEMNRTGKIRLLRTSSLWETKAMYVLDQDKFVNGVCEVHFSPSAACT
jgi:2-amino-4-hydroxy-6-hydroxymethyldihydropteridine diphosphokinase/dihydropteroate synthase